jgi:uncharacterized membrane protein (DUF106 family)
MLGVLIGIVLAIILAWIMQWLTDRELIQQMNARARELHEQEFGPTRPK